MSFISDNSDINSIIVYVKELEYELRKQIKANGVVFNSNLCARVMGQTVLSEITEVHRVTDFYGRTIAMVPGKTTDGIYNETL